MGLLDKVKDFLDDGKINGSTDKPKEAAVSPAPAPEAVKAPQAEETKPAGAPANPDPDKYAMEGDVVEKPFKFSGGQPYKDANGNDVNPRFMGKAVLKAKVQLADKELVEVVLKSAPQLAFFDILMKNVVPREQVPAYAGEISKKIGEVLTEKCGRDFEIQSVIIANIMG
jgi:hypothetical protein